MKLFNLSFEKSVGAVVFRESENGEKEFLLLHYPSGHWDFPKGHVEKGETEERTLRREIEEETGINDLSIVSGFRDSIRYFYNAKGNERKDRILSRNGVNIFKKVIFYLAETKEKNIKISHEHIGFGWFSYEDTVNKLAHQNGKRIMKKAGEFLEISNIRS